MSSNPRVFLSAVADEFPAEMESLRSALADLGCQVIDLSSCPTYWRTVDKRARDLIASCDVVLHIAGTRCGRIPDAATVPPGKARRSIAQMEHDIALELQSPMRLFLSADDTAAPAHLKPESEELSQLQQEHRAFIRASGRALPLPTDAAEWTAQLSEWIATAPAAPPPVVQIKNTAPKAAPKKTEPETIAGMPLAAVAVIVIGLVVVGLGALKLALGKPEKAAEQTASIMDTATVQRVLQAYISSLRDWHRDAVDVPNAYLDQWIRSALPTHLQMPESQVKLCLEQAASRELETQLSLEDKLAAQVAAKRYQAVIDLGLAREKELTAEGLEIAGMAAVAKYDESQLNSHLDRAVKFYRAAIQRTPADDAPVALARRHFALGRILISQGLFKEALPSLREAASKLEPAADQHPEEFGLTLAHLALVQIDDTEAADKAIERAVTLLEQKAKSRASHLRALCIQATRLALGIGPDAASRVAKGEVQMRSHLKEAEAAFTAGHPLTVMHLVPLAMHLAASAQQVSASTGAVQKSETDLQTQTQSRVQEAEGLLTRLLKYAETAYGVSHPQTASANLQLATLLAGMKRHPEAEPHFRRALEISERHFGDKHPTTTRYRMNLAYGLLLADKGAESETHFSKVSAEMQAFGSWPEHEQRDAALMLASSFSKKKKYDEAIPYYEQALSLYPEQAVIERGNIQILLMNTHFSARNLGKARLTAEKALPLVLLNPSHLQNPQNALLPMMQLVGVWKTQLGQSREDVKALFQKMFNDAQVAPEIFNQLWNRVLEGN